MTCMELPRNDLRKSGMIRAFPHTEIQHSSIGIPKVRMQTQRKHSFDLHLQEDIQHTHTPKHTRIFWFKGGNRRVLFASEWFRDNLT